MFKPMTIPQRLTLSFVLVILIGSLLLSLNIMHQPGVTTSYIDHLFTTVSMVCVTGLTTIVVANTYNMLGQMICILLMQIGGLGLITVLAALTFNMKNKLSLKDQLTLQASFTHEGNHDFKALLRSIYRFTALVEGTAALILSFKFVPEFGWIKGIFNAIFISVSAFCNAGFDNLGATSLQLRANDWVLNLVIAFLIIAGGMGFIVWFDLVKIIKGLDFKSPIKSKYYWNKLSTHTQLVLVTTGIILGIGTLATWATEWHNPMTLAKYNLLDQGLISFFQTVTMRTAGFASLDYSVTRPVTNLLYMIQMVIGGAPGGTAGGIKITTAAVLFLLLKAELVGTDNINFKKRALNIRVIRQTIVVIIFFFAMYLVGFGFLLATQPQVEAFPLMFEVTSALATVGVTMNVTGQLDTVGKIVIMFLMFLGRVGPSTVLLSVVTQRKKEIQYPKADIFLG
ncbi:TPA: TrkH family potassium uptake protein [Streptococcus suis]